MKQIRKIVHIDEDKCNGCGVCVPACHEGAIQVIDGKARLLEDFLCDGLGDCLGECPEDAIRIEEREADPFDEEAVKEHLQKNQEQIEGAPAAQESPQPLPCGCPGSRVLSRPAEEVKAPTGGEDAPSRLRQWPVQLALIPPKAPFLKEEKLLVAADCVPFAMAGFHEKLLLGSPVAVGCPKLDDPMAYVDKLEAILKEGYIKEVTVAYMEVPCCGGLVQVLKRAIDQSGRPVALKLVQVSLSGQILKEENL